MSALYGLALIGTWLGLTAWFWKIWRRARKGVESNRRLFDAMCIGIALLWFGASFWYGGGRKIYYDAQVNRLCAIDGGVKVYETVRLPAEMFDKYSFINFYRPTQKEDALGPEYVFKWDLHYIRQGDPSLHRSHRLVLRRSDGKVLGESIGYSRGGGDLPGPWQPSSFSCPGEYGDIPLLVKIFVPSAKE